MNRVKRFFKELKRVRWPIAKDTNIAFWKSMIFIIITSLVLFGVALAFTALWKAFNVGI